MVVAKKASIVIVMVFPLITFSQVLEGDYIFKNGSFSKHYRFYDDMRFDQRSSDVFGHGSHFVKGYFLMKGDSLFLFHDKVPYPYPQSNFEIVRQKKIEHEHSLRVELEITDYENNPISGATIMCKNGDYTLFHEMTDKKGECQIFTEGQFAEYLTVYFLGFRPLRIELKEFWGAKSDLKVKLGKESPNTYNDKYRIEKFIVEKSTEDELVLKDIGRNQRILLKKE